MHNKRFKILFITFEYGRAISGGIGRVINSLDPFLREKIELQIMLVRNYRMFKFTRIYRFPNKNRVTSYHHFQPKLLINLIKKENYDAVHIFHVSIISAAVVKTICSHFPRLKIIYSCHSIAKYESKVRYNHPDMLQYEDLILRHADHLHLLNQTSLNYLKEAYPFIAEKKPHSIIPNGIEEASFQKKDPRFARKMNQLLKKNGKVTVLCMTRWSWGKGLEYLLDAIPEVVRLHPNIQFIITGRRLISWEYRYWDYLQKINRKIAGLGDYVIPMGWMNDRQRNLLLSLADIWVMPSQLEYFPYSILEPMIARVPIISTRIESVVEMLSDNEECLFYEPTRPDQLAERILTLIQNPDLRRKLAENAYHKAKEYHWRSISEMYFEMYRNVINKG
jgi:glycosyltransferase involved in cell wall biosynthesis